MDGIIVNSKMLFDFFFHSLLEMKKINLKQKNNWPLMLNSWTEFRWLTAWTMPILPSFDWLANICHQYLLLSLHKLVPVRAICLAFYFNVYICMLMVTNKDLNSNEKPTGPGLILDLFNYCWWSGFESKGISPVFVRLLLFVFVVCFVCGIWSIRSKYDII